MGLFTVIPQDTFDGLQLDAGVLLKKFDPAKVAAPADEDIICATTGGINISCVPTYSDLGEDVDNCPVNTKELKHLDGWGCKMSFTALGTSPENIKLALGRCHGVHHQSNPQPRFEAGGLFRHLVGRRPGGRRRSGCLPEKRALHRRLHPQDHQERQGTGLRGADRARVH